MQSDRILRADVAIVGAGVMGASTAYWLNRLDPSLSVLLVERDPTYARASSALSASSIRLQFSQPVNIRMSQFGVEFYRGIGEALAVDGDRPDIGLVEPGYLYLANAAQAPSLRAANATQRALGASVELLEPAQLARRFPWLRTDDLALGSHGVEGEGWFDGYAVLAAFLRKARAQGARVVQGEAAAFELDGERVAALRLADGTRVVAGRFVNAAGPWSAAVARMAGLEFPVRARRRTVFVFSSPAKLERCPLLIDPTGFWMRPEGAFHIGGLEPLSDEDDAPLDPEYDRFDTLWEALAHRIPGFEALRFERAWAGYYEMNTVDHNAVIGAHPRRPNLFFAAGFSGHGMQHAPAAGRGLAERIVHGEYRSLDLSPLGFERLLENRPLLEANVIG